MGLYHLLKLGRPLNALMVFVAALLGSLIAGKLDLLAPLSAALISMGAQAINDCFDVDVDKKKKGRPVAEGYVSVRQCKAVAVVYYLAGGLIAVVLTLNHLILALIAILSSYLYSSKMRQLKYVGNILVSFLVALTVVYGGVRGEWLRTLPVAVIIFLVNWAREIVKDIADEGADEGKKLTLVKIVGRDIAIAIACQLIVVGVALSPFPLFIEMVGDGFILPMGIADLMAIVACTLALIGEADMSAKILKGAMGMALLAFLLGVIV